VYSDGEPRLTDRATLLVDEKNAVVAVTRTGPEGEYRFVGAPAARDRVEAVAYSEWAGTVVRAFTVGTEPVKLGPLALPPAGDAAEEGALPGDEGAPATEAADAYWALLGAALPIFLSRKDRRSAAEAARHWSY
jgi:hypothetical protein